MRMGAWSWLQGAGGSVVTMPGKRCRGRAASGLAVAGLWVLVWGALAGSGANACPTLCTCSGTTVDCHGLGIKTVPRNIPRNTERL